jgi:pyruvate formate lyase activating enzyme
VQTLADYAPGEVIAKAAAELGCRSVAYTYNDPVIFQEYAIDVAKRCHARGIKSVAVTAGEHCPEPRAEFYQHMDACNVDLKAFTQRFYKQICLSQLEPVLDTLKYLKHETDVWFEITNLVIPGENDSTNEIDEMTKWIVKELGPDVPVHFSAFHPDFRMMDKPATPPETLDRARRIALDNGVHYAYTGNVYDPAGQTTYCHDCGQALIVRDNYDILQWRLTEDATCPDCGTRCAGVFEAQPGRWGSRYLPVRLGDYSKALMNSES